MTPKRVLFVRTTNEVHRAADETATRLGLSLNAFCVEAILKDVEHHSPTPEGIETNVETQTPTQETGQGETLGQETQGGQETAERDAGVFAEAAAQALKRADDKAKESPKFPDDGNGKSIAETQAENKKSEPASKPKRSRKKSK